MTEYSNSPGSLGSRPFDMTSACMFSPFGNLNKVVALIMPSPVESKPLFTSCGVTRPASHPAGRTIAGRSGR